MIIYETLNKLCICPIDGDLLLLQESHLVCNKCGKKYVVDKNVVYFCDENDRPLNPKNLSLHYMQQHPDGKKYVEQERQKKDIEYKENAYARNFIDFAAVDSGIIVDVATGPHGAFIQNTLDNIGDDTILIATDACPYVIKHYSEMNRTKNFIYFDVDLNKTLPFADESIDAFTGVLMSNVQNYEQLLTEISRCLKSGGRAVFFEVFYDEKSDSYALLQDEKEIYASSDMYIKFCERLGLSHIKTEICQKSIGKMDPGDGMPISDTDEWYTKNIYFCKP